MGVIKLVLDVIKPLVNNPDDLNVTIEKEEERFVQVKVVTNSEDTARLIGKGGNVAEAIRESVNVIGKLNNSRVHVKFESFNDVK